MQPAPTSSPDPILETQLFWTRYKTPIFVLLVIGLCVAAGFAAYRAYTAHREATAAELLAQAKTGPEYEKVIADYPQTGAAASAYILEAAQQRDKQQFADANATLEKFIAANPAHELVSAAKMAVAANLESMGKTDDALAMYRQIAENHAQSFNAPLALLAQVPLFKQKGQIEEARRACETVMTRYRESYAAMEAPQLLKMLKPTATAAPVPVVAPSVAPVAASPANSATPKP